MNHKQVPGALDKRALLALGQEADGGLCSGKETAKPSLRADKAEQGATGFQLLVLFPFVCLIFSIITVPSH